MNSFLIKGLKVYTENTIQKQAAVMVENGIIQEIFSHAQHQKFCEKHTFQFPANYHLVPGFIDMHIHGTHGADVMDGTHDTIDTICHSLPIEGTTGFLATTISQSFENIEKAIENITKYMQTPYLGAEILGLHLEGPFISPQKPGVHNVAHIQPVDLSLFEKWEALAKNLIKVVTLAPEMAPSSSFIKHLNSQSTIASMGHSNASFEEALHAIHIGFTQATHLFNAMSSIHHRTPGCALACLLHPEVYTEIIADGIHLHPAMIHLVYRLKGPDKIILITDSMRAKGMEDGKYEIGGKSVQLKGGKVVTEDGVLAGSILSMNDAFKNMHNYLQCPIEDLIAMSATNAAIRCGVENRKGTIAKGKEADLVVLNEELDVVFTVCRGKIAYERK